MERTISEIREEHKSSNFTMNDEQYKLYQQQREQFSYTRDFLLTIRDSVAFWPKLPSVPDLITEEEAISDTKSVEDNKFVSRGNIANSNSFARNRRRDHSDRDWDQVNKDKHDQTLAHHDWRQDRENERDTSSRSDRDWKDKSDVKAFRRDSQPVSERDKDWLEKKDRKEGWNYVGKTEFRSRRGHTNNASTSQQETLDSTENSESIVLGPPRKVFPSSQPGSINPTPPNPSSTNLTVPSKRHDRNPGHRNAEKNYVNFATERPPTKRTSNVVGKPTRDASDSVEQTGFIAKKLEPYEMDNRDSSSKSDAKEQPSNFVDSLFQTENSQKFSWDELMSAFNGLPSQTSKFDTTLASDTANDSDQDVDDPVSVTASRAFGRWFSPETQPKENSLQHQTLGSTSQTNSSNTTGGKQNVDSDNSGNILQELLQTAIQGSKTQQDQQHIHVVNQSVQFPTGQPQSESQSFIASLLSKPQPQTKISVAPSSESKLHEHPQQPANANSLNMYGRPLQFIPPQYPLHSTAPPTQYYHQMAPNGPPPANSNVYSQFFQPNVYQQQYHPPSQSFHGGMPTEIPSSSGSNLLEKLFGAVQGTVPLPPLPQHGKVVSLEEIEKTQRK